MKMLLLLLLFTAIILRITTALSKPDINKLVSQNTELRVES
jgi:hypothetical protein